MGDLVTDATAAADPDREQVEADERGVHAAWLAPADISLARSPRRAAWRAPDPAAGRVGSTGAIAEVFSASAGPLRAVSEAFWATIGPFVPQRPSRRRAGFARCWGGRAIPGALGLEGGCPGQLPVRGHHASDRSRADYSKACSKTSCGICPERGAACIKKECRDGADPDRMCSGRDHARTVAAVGDRGDRFVTVEPASRPARAARPRRRCSAPQTSRRA